jgi:hypothetical protein
MGLFQKKGDPISDRARELSAEISALEAEIRKLSDQLETRQAAAPRVRSTALPQSRATASREPVFEPVDQNRLKATAENGNGNPGMYNDLGMRKYDLPALFRRLRHHFSARPPTTNPKLVNYLAAGSIQGLRPLRYEKRVARNRFIFLTAILLLALWWIIASFW